MAGIVEQNIILYHASPYRNLNSILSQGLVVQPVPEFIAGHLGLPAGVYLGDSDAVDGFVEGLFLFEGEGKVAVFSVHLDTTELARLTPDLEMEDEEVPGVYHAWVYPEPVPPEKIQFDRAEVA